MIKPLSFANFRSSLSIWMSGPHVLAFLPAIVLGGFWLGGESALIGTALLTPCFIAWARFQNENANTEHTPDTLENALQEFVDQARGRLRQTACFIVEIDGFSDLGDRLDKKGASDLSKLICNRLASVVRDADVVIEIAPGQYGVALSPVRKLDSEICLKLGARMRAAVEEPVSVGASSIHITVSIGLCTDRVLKTSCGQELADAAALALFEARRFGPSAVRIYSPDLKQVFPARSHDDDDLLSALKNGEIRAWFQPQVCTNTGKVSGFEALARWCHPTRGVVSPADFLDRLRQHGQINALGSIMLRDSLKALRSWHAQGFDVETIGVNLSPEELRDPNLPEKIRWELECFNIAPEHLSVEVLETVVSYSPDDVVSRNVHEIANLGCLVDLDDFGTGSASISSIRRFAVQRLKIDRSFVKDIDRDQDQQRMVNAILLMAEQLGLDTIAEGVETAGEHAMLAQLGCGHVQGYGLGHPMPFEQTVAWMIQHKARMQSPPDIGRNTA